ncbi:MAG: cytochrome P460 family protein [Caulobacteraceae bacterium]
MSAAVALGVAGAVVATAQTPSAGPTYTVKGEMQFPADYRRWVYLSSGLDMSYRAGPPMAGMPAQFDNVFVDPAAYDAFLKTGTWPDNTVMVLETRRGEQNGSINTAGHFQAGRLGVEVHVKDTAQFKQSQGFAGGWAFYGFDGEGPGQLIPTTAACYACHEAHAAVDRTFVQFYPTLKPIAAEKGTFSANYLAEEAGAKNAAPGR